jgi:hypothetical protein
MTALPHALGANHLLDIGEADSAWLATATIVALALGGAFFATLAFVSRKEDR